MAQATKNTSRASKTALSGEVFSVSVPNHELMKLAYEAYLANNRTAGAIAKTRGEVRGGGKKPWRQKGTGRARHGSIRNPIWRTGGVVFGPRGTENYAKSISKRAKRRAVRQALTVAHQAGRVAAVDDIKTEGKTREIVSFLDEHNAGDARRALLVVDEKTPELIRATANLRSVVLVRATYLTVYHVLNADKLFITKAAVERVAEWLSPAATTAGGKR